MYNTLRERDMRIEYACIPIIDGIYKIFGFQRKWSQSKSAQLHGIDLGLKKVNGPVLLVDNKMAATWHDAYATLPTFCAEILFKNKHGKWVIGWIFDEKSQTTHLALIFPYSVDDFKSVEKGNRDPYLILNNLVAMEILIVPKNDAVELLHSVGIFNYQDAGNYLKKYYSDFSELKRYSCRVNKDVKVCWSRQLAEQPLTAPIRRGWYEEHAIHRIDFDKRKNPEYWDYMKDILDARALHSSCCM